MDVLVEILKALFPYILASLPGIWALVTFKLKIDADKRLTDVTIKKGETEITEKTVGISDTVQNIYRKMLEDLEEQLNDTKTQLAEVVKEVELLKVEQREQIKVHALKISELETKLAILVAQLEALNVKPETK